MNRERDSITSLLTLTYTREDINEYASGTDVYGTFMLIEVENLNQLNEMYGYSLGDKTLASIAGILTKTFRNSDIIGRVSSGRFVVFMKGKASKDLIYQKANEICREVQKIYSETAEQKANISIGVSCFPDHGSDYAQLAENAEAALEWSKESGRNLCRIYESDMVGSSLQYMNEGLDVNIVEKDYEAFYNEISKMTFRLMEDTTDADSSIQLLMKHIMDYFGFAVVATLLVVPDKPRTLKTVYTVVGEGIFNNKDHETQYTEERWNYIKKVMERGRYMFCSDIDNPECENIFPDYHAGEIVSGLRLPMGNKTYFSGITDFVYVGKEHRWEEREIRLLESFTRILSVYISRINTFDESAYLAKLMKERDSITGLYSYEMFLSKMKEIIAKQESWCDIVYTYSDFKNFKYINDTYGYNVGNLLLRKFGELLINSGDEDFLCAARLHSDNIVVARKNTAEIPAQRYAVLVDKCNDYIMKELRNYVHDNMVNIRSGIYVATKESITVEEAVTNAGYACKKSKDNSTSKCMLFTEDLMEDYKKQLRYISELEHAMESGQIQVYIQPKTMSDGVQVVGGEALVRWIKPDGSMVFPGDFIPIFEKSGDIIHLDYFVYREVFKYQRERMEKHLPVVPISVNVSKLHLKNDNLQSYLESLFEEYDIPVELIELELTENVYIENISDALRLLNWCKEKNIKVAMDDFGSGYSSLNMLDQVPIDIMKVDRIFLKNPELQKSERIILEHVISMADKLDITTVCEGVESKEQLEFLADIGCDVIQGYYIGKPMPMDAFDKYLETHCCIE